MKTKELGAIVAVKKNLTQEDICISTRFFKGQQLSVCRFVSIYNELPLQKIGSLIILKKIQCLLMVLQLQITYLNLIQY